MAIDSNIGWTRSTFNPWIGCTKVSPGCDHCYASVSTPARSLGVKWGAGQPRRRTSEANWRQPIKWNAEAARTGEFWPVFCSSLADVFDNEVPPEWRADLFLLMERTPNLTWLVLTKRIGNAGGMLPALWHEKNGGRMPPNVWIGATIVNQEEADRDIPKLLAVPAAKRFVSYEPALGPVDWTDIRVSTGEQWNALDRVEAADAATEGLCSGTLDWIIIGGESDQPGMRARPFDVEWARSTIAQCKAAGVACFVKQLGSNPAPLIVEAGSVRERLWLKDRAGADPAEWPDDLRVQEWPL